MKSVAIYSTQTILAFGLKSIISEAFSVKGIFDSLEGIGELLRDDPPDILVIEHDSFTDVKTVQELRSSTSTRIVVWVDNVPAEFFAQCLAAGVSGIITKSSSVGTHIRCLTEVAQGNVWFDQRFVDRIPTTRQIHLTRRERQIMGLIVQGLCNKDLAWAMKIGEGTVKVYLSRLFDKLGVMDRFELALIGLRNLNGSVLLEQKPRNSPPEAVPFPSFLCLQGEKPGIGEQAELKRGPGRSMASVPSASFISRDSLAG